MYQGVAAYLPNEGEHRRQIAQCVNTLNKGKMNCTLTVTLTANASSTTVKDSRIASTSHFSFMPTTAHASAELASGNLYVPVTTLIAATGSTPGSAIIQHTNNAQTDRTFVLSILG